MKNGKEQLVSILSPIVLLSLWEIASRIGMVDNRFFPAPSTIFIALGKMFTSGELWLHLKASVFRIVMGFIVGGLPGLVLGISMGLSRWLRAVLKPIIAATYPIPKSAILPLIMLIFGLGEGSKIVIIGISVFFLVLINSMAGVMNIDRIYFDVAKSAGASRWQIFRTVAIPGALPLIFTGFKLGIGIGLVVIVIAEYVGAKEGIGFMIWQSWTTFSVDKMFVGFIVISVLGYLFVEILETLERAFVPWKPEH